jgi:hypothetical protein
MELIKGSEVLVGGRRVLVEDVTEWGDTTYTLFKYGEWPIVISSERVEKSGKSIFELLDSEVQRIAKLAADGYLRPLQAAAVEQVEVGHVGVDSGKILIVDPCYLHPPTEGRAGAWIPEKHYEECEDATSSGGAAQLASMSAVAASTDGDGNYPVVATMKHGRVLKIEIEFMTEAEADQGAAYMALNRASAAATAAATAAQRFSK